MKRVAILLGALAWASAVQASCLPAPEEAFVACLSQKQPDLIAKIRDASGQDAFVAALKEGTEICPIEVEGMSMGKLFKALNAHKQGKSDA